MQGIRIRAAQTVHPEYFAGQNRSTGDKVPPFIDHDIGEIVTSADMPRMCLGSDPMFAPHDDECRTAVAALLKSPRRVHELERLQSMYSNRGKLSKGARQYVEAIFENHKAEIEGVSTAQIEAAGVIRRRYSKPTEGTNE